eukprot:1619421-Rhodomonas_salina.4
MAEVMVTLLGVLYQAQCRILVQNARDAGCARIRSSTDGSTGGVETKARVLQVEQGCGSDVT